jgi:hypothetical protein
MLSCERGGYASRPRKARGKAPGAKWAQLPQGKEAEPGLIAATCLREGVSYMMDFIPDNQSSQIISQIDFTRISQTDSGHETHVEESHPNIAVWHCS